MVGGFFIRSTLPSAASPRSAGPECAKRASDHAGAAPARARRRGFGGIGGAQAAKRPSTAPAPKDRSPSCFALQLAADPEEGDAAQRQVELFPHVVADDAEVEADAHVGEAEGLQHL